MTESANALEVDQDERRLVRLFRCLDNAGRSELLRGTAEQLVAQLRPEPGVQFEPDEFDDESAAPREDVEEQLQFLKPPMEPWDYLGEYLGQALHDAWPEGIAETPAYLGSSVGPSGRPTSPAVHASAPNASCFDVRATCKS